MTVRLPTLEQLERAADVVYQTMTPTAQHSWPLLNAELGAQVWLKHENQTPLGAFKMRGGLVYFQQLVAAGPKPAGVISATRGNHGQSIAFAARKHEIASTIVVPHGNSREKNAAMRALGAELIEHGEDFQEAREHATQLAERRKLHMVPSFHPFLVQGVASWALELMHAVHDLHTLYVPIGLGSGICGAIAVREALGLPVEIVGVVSADAPAYARSFEYKEPVERPARTELADGLACRKPEPVALEIILAHVARIVEVTDSDVADAMRLVFSTTHTVAEGAGAAGVAAMLREKGKIAGRKVATVLCGANVDRPVFAKVLAG
ncbi:MAG: threonine dehydratase [Burkholderiales bacterium]|jgi:threonine dehydratase|nr:threonine dehydratase [Burkholderiales bacterium]